ncbi:hypothetical protein EC537_04210 [Helicobacter pylori]|nr:hypothetical protein EC537_04210 [Helicobacter pylori]
MIELRISSNTDNIFPIKIIDSNSDFIRQVITCFDNLFQKIAHISEKFSLISFTSNTLAIRPTLTLGFVLFHSLLALFSLLIDLL